MAERASIWRMWQNGTWNHPTLGQYDPGPTDPVDPNPPSDGLWFGTTLIGQSYANYKKWTIAGEANRYKQVEYDTVYQGNRGSAVARSFGPTGGNIGTWSTMVGSAIRSNQPVIYSWKDGGGHDLSTESNFKAELRDFLDSRPGGSTTRVWLAYAHEFDNDGSPSESNPTYFNGKSATGVGMERWYARNLWMWQVLQETAYDQMWARNGGWVKIGWITTGTPYQHGKPNTDNRSWKRYVDEMAAYASANEPALSGLTGAEIGELWDYHGCDKYNPNWDGNGPDYYMTWANWSLKFSQAHAYTGLPIVIAEAGSARDIRTANPTQAQINSRDAERAAWLDNQYASMTEAGYYDCVTYWRVPKSKGTAAEQLNGEFSTNMITPTGYNAEMLAAEGVVVGRTGSDAQAVCDVHNEWCIKSIQQANALGIGPSIPYYTGGPA